MSPLFFAGTLAAWALAYLAVAFFFTLAYFAARRHPEYLLFSAVVGALALMSGGIVLNLAGQARWTPLLGSAIAVTGALVACAFQLHFSLRLAGRLHRGALISIYTVSVLVSMAVWAQAAALWRAGAVVPWGSILLLRSAPALGALVMTCGVVGLFSSIGFLWTAYRRGRPEALLLIGSVSVVGAAMVHDGVVIAAPDGRLTQLMVAHVLWIYVVAMAATLLLRYRGAEGRLAETASSLRARTAELRRSHAELVKVQEELVRKEQLAAVGELAASIAHEVRNPLAVIVNAGAGLRRRNLPEQDRETLLTIIDEETDRLNRLVTELLRFARPVAAKRSPASLVELCQAVQRSHPSGYDVVISIPDDPLLQTIWVDPALFRLVLENLVANACQAMRNGGTVTLDVHPGHMDDGAPSVVIDVIDGGHGMDLTVLKRATSPFFTTRPSGTGLGLPIVQRIIEAHGGDLRLRSEPGVGTTASVRIPFGPDQLEMSTALARRRETPEPEVN